MDFVLRFVTHAPESANRLARAKHKGPFALAANALTNVEECLLTRHGWRRDIPQKSRVTI